MSINTFSTARPARPARLRVALELPADLWRARTLRWIDLTARQGPEPETVRIKAADLRTAQRKTAAIRDAAKGGRAPIDVVVLVDLEVMIAAEASSARAQMNCLEALMGETNRPASLRYVGTPAGLAGLISDIFTAGVADGVTLQPLSGATLDEVLDTTLPELEPVGLAVDAARCDFVAACRCQRHSALAPSAPPPPDIARTARIA